MFIISVLAFCAGIYLQAYYPLPLSVLCPLSLATAVLALLWVYSRRIPALLAPTAFLLVLACFILVGAMRLSFLHSGLVVPQNEQGDALYEGIVTESSPRIKTLVITGPPELKRMRVAILSAPELEAGQKVRVFGRMKELIPSFKNPGTRSWKWLKRLEGIAFELKGRVVSVSGADDVVSRLRGYFKHNLEKAGANNTDILKALTIGDRAAISDEKNNLFQRTGTSHVLAISGFNVGIISGFFFLIARFMLGRISLLRISGRNTRYASLITIPFPFIFMLVAGAGVSVIRATIMIIVFMLALFFEREKHVYNTMALAALVILVIYPHSLFTPSFQLTFMSLFFIVVFMERLFPIVKKLKGKIVTWSLSTILSTIAATLGTAPIVIYYFYGINPFCLIHNLITIPLIGIGATVLSLIGIVVPGGHYLLIFAGEITGFNIRILQSLDFGYLYPLIRPDFLEVLLYYALLLALVNLRRKVVAAFLVLVWLPLAFTTLYGDYRMRFNDDMRINFIDVGIGDATLIEAPGGIRILIDGGGFHGSDFDVGKHVIAPLLLYKKIGHIDYVINTHPHEDHCGGLRHILQHFSVTNFVTGGPFPADVKFLELRQAAAARGVPHITWSRGDGLRRDNFSINVLHPAGGVPHISLNNSSLVLRVVYGNQSVLLPADIESDVEDGLILSGSPLRSTVLKVPHHGSATSNTSSFISAVDPKLAVVSTASGIKNLPSPAALARYRIMSIPVVRTDADGMIEIRSDGKKISYRTYGREF